MRFLVIFLLLMSFPCVAIAEGQVGGGDGGSLRPLSGQNPAVCMVREKVRITFSKTGSYAVLVDYIFRNEGPSRKVAMGLPENDLLQWMMFCLPLTGGLQGSISTLMVASSPSGTR